MGKAEEELSLSAAAAQEEEGRGSPGGNAGARCRHCLWIRRVVRPRCVAALVLGVAVLLSALFWLPPFLRDGADPDGLDSQAGSNIIASFQLRKPLSQLKAYIPELQYDVSAEIGVANSSVIIISLERLPASNWTNVVFGIWPYPKDSNISSAGLSILRSNFVMLVTQQSTLRLTASLFGNPSFFQVLQFPGGITIIPPQSGFLLQKQLMFNFTLNFSINQVYNKINELKDQMKSGLHLNYFENLYVSLTNLRGSTVTPPTIIQTSILLSVGNRPPSQLRLKELAQAITPARNLGLNNTVFGIVKQIRLSSFLNHSINGAGAPSSAPEPHPSHPSHHHHHHHNNKRSSSSIGD
uniref:DUF7036 domain-containing protein n=1 Tax=Anthurium amnicola TaxID=1678845 RepID=A0A1D1ZAE7_9ARAE